MPTPGKPRSVRFLQIACPVRPLDPVTTATFLVMRPLFSRYSFGTNLHVYPLARGASLKIPSNTRTGPILFNEIPRPNSYRHNGNTSSPAVNQQESSRPNRSTQVWFRSDN